MSTTPKTRCPEHQDSLYYQSKLEGFGRVKLLTLQAHCRTTQQSSRPELRIQNAKMLHHNPKIPEPTSPQILIQQPYSCQKGTATAFFTKRDRQSGASQNSLYISLSRFLYRHLNSSTSYLQHVHMYIYRYICMKRYVHAYTYIYICICLCICICTHTCMLIHIYIYI